MQDQMFKKSRTKNICLGIFWDSQNAQMCKGETYVCIYLRSAEYIQCGNPKTLVTIWNP